jgi:hypothetical protein
MGHYEVINNPPSIPVLPNEAIAEFILNVRKAFSGNI